MGGIVREKQNSSLTKPIRFGRDEMNLIEFPFGPIKASKSNTFEAEHIVRDRSTKKLTCRKLMVTGSSAFGLPRPVDEQVLIGLKALTQDAGFQSRKVFFSQYHLCQILGWNPDGRAYRRIESSLDRIAGTTLKYKNAWWDSGDQSWRSHTFHLLDNIELCSEERLQKKRRSGGGRKLPLCWFVWNEVVWKSFHDGYIKKIDMEMFRRIANGRRREVPVRLYRWLDKQFYKKKVVRFNVERLAVGTLGLGGKFPSDFRRVIGRASQVLIDCKFLEDFCFRSGKNHGGIDVLFRKWNRTRNLVESPATCVHIGSEKDEHKTWISSLDEEALFRAETEAVGQQFGHKLERERVRAERKMGTPVKESSLIRQQYIRRFLDPQNLRKMGVN